MTRAFMAPSGLSDLLSDPALASNAACTPHNCKPALYIWTRTHAAYTPHLLYLLVLYASHTLEVTPQLYCYSHIFLSLVSPSCHFVLFYPFLLHFTPPTPLSLPLVALPRPPTFS